MTDGLTFVSEWLEDWAGKAPKGLALDLGAGEGATARWLAERGFQVEAIERDPALCDRLVSQCRGLQVRVRCEDLREASLAAGTYSLIVAEAVLHFLRPTDLWPLADRLVAALRPGGLLVAEVLTTDDPGCEALRRAGAPEVEPNTFQAPGPVGLLHYFAPDELRRLFAGLEVLEYEESRRLDAAADPPYRAAASLVARKPEESA